jgi:phage-related protein (TIGR01555 family)
MADERSLITRIVSRVAGRLDSSAPPPPIADAVYEDPQPNGGGIRGFVRSRVDSMRNSVLGIGDDKVDATRPDRYRDPLTYSELTSLWRYNGYARRFVEVIPQDATRRGWSLTDAAGVDIPDVADEHERLSVFAKVAEADAWGRLYGGAWLLMVTEEDLPAEFLGNNSKAWLAEPLELDRVRTLQNLVVLDWSEVTPESFESDPRQPTFRQPKRYRVSPSSGGLLRGGLSHASIVHASRMIYFGGSKLPPQLRYQNNGCDDSILQSVWDQLRNKSLVDFGLAAVAAEMRISKLKIRDLADPSVSDEAEYFDTRMHMLAKHKSILNTVLLTANEEYSHEQGTVAGMGEIDSRMLQGLQAVTGMPEQLWIGSAPGGLSTDGDSHRNLWANVVESYQVTKYGPNLRPLYDVMFAADAGPWKGKAPEEWQYKWSPLDELTQKGKADLQKVVADTDAIYLDRGVISPEQVAEGRFGEQGWQAELPSSDTTSEQGGVDLEAVQAFLEQEGDPGEAGPVAPPTPDGLAERRALAEQLTDQQIPRCEHGRPNRCPQCGIERVRGLAVNDDGEVEHDAEGNPVFAVAWRAIGDVPVEPEPEAEPEADDTGRIDALRTLRQNRRIDAAAAAVRGGGTSLREALAQLDRRLDPAPQRRVDADGDEVGIWVGLPWPEDAREAWESARLEAATLAGLTVDELDLKGHGPHVTLLWVGKVPKAKAEAEAARVGEVFDKLLADHRAIDLRGCGLWMFQPSPGSEGDTPLYIEVDSSALRGLHEEASKQLLGDEERCARRWYSPHATVGYYPGELPASVREQLWRTTSGRGEWTADRVELSVGGVVVRGWDLERAD